MKQHQVVRNDIAGMRQSQNEVEVMVRALVSTFANASGVPIALPSATTESDSADTNSFHGTPSVAHRDRSFHLLQTLAKHTSTSPAKRGYHFDFTRLPEAPPDPMLVALIAALVGDTQAKVIN